MSKIFKETEFFDNYINGFDTDNHDSTKCMKFRKFKDTLVNHSTESHIKGDNININVTSINNDAQILNKLITDDDIFIGYININIATPPIYDTFFLQLKILTLNMEELLLYRQITSMLMNVYIKMKIIRN